jgi:hypothetical protein
VIIYQKNQLLHTLPNVNSNHYSQLLESNWWKWNVQHWDSQLSKTRDIRLDSAGVYAPLHAATISQIVFAASLQVWLDLTLLATDISRGEELVENVTVATARLVRWSNPFLRWEHGGDGLWWEWWTTEATTGLITDTAHIPHIPKSQCSQTLKLWSMNRICAPHLAENQDPSAENY